MRSQTKPKFAVKAFLKLFKNELVDAAYEGILGRPADPKGRLAYADALVRSGNLAEVLRLLSHCDELAIQLPRANFLEIQKSAICSHYKSLPHVATSGKKILLLGNCQVRSLLQLMQAMLSDADISAIELLPDAVKRIEDSEPEISRLIVESDLIFFHPHGEAQQAFRKNFSQQNEKVRLIPRIAFSGFHPDIDYVEDSKGNKVPGPLGGYHSSIAFWGWKNLLSVSATLNLFREEVYESLGYFEYATASRELLLAEGELTGTPLGKMLEKWSARGCWMYSMNHPKLFCLADVARAVLEQEGMETLPGVEEFVDDVLGSDAVLPMYPEVANKLGLAGHYLFKRGTDLALRGLPVSMLSLQQFVEESFTAFSKYPREELTCQRLVSRRYEALKASLAANEQAPAVAATSKVSQAFNAAETPPNHSPYEGLPDYQFWRRAIERLPMEEVNPVAKVRFTLSRETRVATAGSCFAQHISRTLRKNGFNYYVAETGAELAIDEAAQRNFGVFSARYGNVYTARQLGQLLDRAYGRFTPSDSYWLRGDGRLVDPFRPQIETVGFDSPEAVEQSRAEHFASVREMFESLDVFVFTLGLTEAWRSRHDGAVFPLAPGVVAGEMSADRYEFVNFDVNEVVADMQAFIGKLLQVNPDAKIILTVSPVPLIATYENQHVLVATTYSKAVLRAAAQEISKRNPLCDYFPSFEIITGNYNRGAYFESDLRSIKPAGVDHVMRLFMASYSVDAGMQPTNAAKSNSVSDDIRSEIARVNEVVCDEEAIDPVGKR